MIGAGQATNLRIQLMPLTVFLAALTATGALFYHRARTFEVVGLARGRVHQVAPTCTVRVIDVPVRLYQRVACGQTVVVTDAVLENEPLWRQLGTVQAQIEHLSAQMPVLQEEYRAEEVDRRIRYAADRRRLERDVENARLLILDISEGLASDRKLLSELEIKHRASRRLVEHGDIAANEAASARLQYEALAAEIEQNDRWLHQARVDLEQCLARRVEFVQLPPYHPDPNLALDVLRKEIAVQRRVRDELLARLSPVELKSPVDGVVVPIQGDENEVLLRRPGENLMRMPGEVVDTGDPVLAVAEAVPYEVVAYVEERHIHRFREGMTVELVKHSGSPQITRSQITQISPVMELMPRQLWLDAATPQWGRPIVVQIPPDMELVPGQSVRIRIL